VKDNPWIGPNRVQLLNQQREIIAWQAPDWPRLWTYTLHYFDFADAERVDRWIAENPAAQGIGWEPYPTSRRIVNWIKFALAGTALPQQVLSSLATQAAHLSDCIERRVLGNHILANAKALYFAGSFFEGTVAERWRAEGLRILRRELLEQVLPDGGHFERSAMYHSLVLEDVLDVQNLSTAYGTLIPALPDCAARMIAWLRAMTHPDGEIPFFNDATFGTAPAPSEIVDYAHRLGVPLSEVALNDSGYIRLNNQGTVVLFDAGPIGPDYQPGHAHADTLSFEMSGQHGRLLVNSGTSTYEAGEQRNWERSTAAHNTVRVDGIDQSEMWHSFRVGRRARTMDIQTDHGKFAEAAHDGYKHLRGAVVHRRKISLVGRDVEITDSLEGSGTHEVEIFFHMHPSAAPKITTDSKLSESMVMTTYHPGFNLSVPNTTLVGRYTGRLPVAFICHISAG
jgi:uncharacterized heparinase superfamily protein